MQRALDAHDWTNADILAVQESDPLAVRLTQFVRLLTPGAAGAKDIADFIIAHPGWPELGQLRKRLNDAVPQDNDDAEVHKICAVVRPTAAPALLRCATAERAAGKSDQAAEYARRAWISGVTSVTDEQALLAAWGATLSLESQLQRFDTLAWANDPAADRQLDRLDIGHRAVGAARLAFRRGGPDAISKFDAVPPTLRADPMLLLEQARYLRAHNDLPGALAAWRSAAPVETLVPLDRRAAFWSERERLARLLLAAGDDQGAFFLADDAAVGPDQAPDALFLAGWIALQRLHDPARAAARFKALAASSSAVITQGRAWYWLARATADPDAARGDLAKSAAYVTTFYGQQSIARLDGAVAARLANLRDPEATPAQTDNFVHTELARGAKLFAAWGSSDQARAFLTKAGQDTPDVTTLVPASRMADSLGYPDVTVQLARIAGRQGIMLPRLGWPIPYRPVGDVDPALALSLMRQESSFDPGVVSGAGAVGLMQLMPATARQLGVGALPLTDAATNIRLGTEYLQGLLNQFDNHVPIAIAAYNAGPRHVREWMDEDSGLLASGRNDDLIDWIEQIPFAETRNYVQRVLESRAIYAAELNP